MQKKKSLIYSVVFMLILSAIMTFFLALLNKSTQKRVEQNAELKLKKSILYVFSIENNGSIEDILDKYDKNVKETDKKFNDETILSYEKNGKVKAYAFALKGTGLWAPVEAYMAVSPDYKQILGVDFIKQSETPGLGGRIEEESYKGQYRNIKIDEISEKVDFISGATGTSTAVQKLIEDDLKEFLTNKGGK